jgi:hypothetical protein
MLPQRAVARSAVAILATDRYRDWISKGAL